jgi:hypothetical protein
MGTRSHPDAPIAVAEVEADPRSPVVTAPRRANLESNIGLGAAAPTINERAAQAAGGSHLPWTARP